MHPGGPFSIPDIRDFVPERVKPWILIAMLMVFQICGGVYLAAINEMVGSTALMLEDIQMAGYATMVGMALTFTIMFRLKFRFPSKVALIVCSAALILCNLAAMHTRSVPVLVAVCFAAGVFRMWGTFICNTTIQLWITPKRDMAVWFCYIQLVVQSSIQLSGLATTYVAFLSQWESMHYVVIGLFLGVILLAVTIFRSFRAMRKLPLFGIDWLGAALWGTTALAVLFILTYGEHYDWFYSEHIRAAVGIAVVSLALNLWRASFIRHPYIDLQTWRYPVVYMTFILYLVFDLLLAPSHLFEHLYFEAILGYDALNTISLNWAVLVGGILGVIFTWLTFARRQWSYKTMSVLGFAFVTLYLVIFYFTIDYHLPKEALILPLMLRAAGYMMVAICFLTLLARVPIFPQFAQALSVQAFVSASIGGALGATVLGQLFERAVARNAATLGATLDRVNPIASRMHLGELYGALQQQAVMVSMKELFGWLALAGIFCLLLFLLHESRIIRTRRILHPTWRAIRRLLRREVASAASAASAEIE